MKSTRQSSRLLLATITIASLPTGVFLAMVWVRTQSDSLYVADEEAERRLLMGLVFSLSVSIYLLSYFLWRRRSYAYLLIPITALVLSTASAIAIPQLFGRLIRQPLSYELFGTVLLNSSVLSGALNAVVFGFGKAASRLFDETSGLA
jgi:hypothetical protein